jgi:dTDP-4-dehydrorhamnose reductase
MLGHRLVKKFAPNFEVWATFRGPAERFADLDFFEGAKLVSGVSAERIETVEAVLAEMKPDVVVNAIGVIKQLPESKDVIRILTVNSIFPHRLAELGRRHGFRLVNISTDCVFSGARGDYREGDVPDATDLYGISKRLGEVTGEGSITLRTSIVGRELGTAAHSLVEWFLSNRGGAVKGFRRAIYSGFPTAVLADILEMIILEFPDLGGLFHVSSEKIDKCELLELIDRACGAGVRIEPDDDFVIDRSLDSSRFRQKTGFSPPSWEEMIEIMARDARIYEKIRR